MKKILIVLFVLVGLVVVVGLVAPKDFHVEREVIINKPKDVVFFQLKYVKNHNQWSPWVKKDPNIVQEYKGTDGTVGFISSWSGNDQVGVGEQEITRIVEGEKIEFELRFKKPMEDTSQAYLITESVGENQTKVRWGMTGKSPFPGNVVCLLMNMKDKIGQEFQNGLNDLKSILEKN